MDTGVTEGDTIPADFDSMIAKIIAYGRDRDEALGRLRRACAQTTVIIDGGATNKSFVLDLLSQPEVIDASADTGWIDRVRGPGPPGLAPALRRRPGRGRHRRLRGRGTGRAAASAVHGVRWPSPGAAQERPAGGVPAPGGRVPNPGRAHRRAPVPGRIEAGEDVRTADVELNRFDRYTGQILVNGIRYRLVTGTFGPIHLVEVDGVNHRISQEDGGVVRSPAPALVVATPLKVGAEVEADTPVLVLESMKMETVLRAPFRARLKECLVSVGSQVQSGAPLLRLEPLVAGDDRSRGRGGSSSAREPAELDLPVARGEVPVPRTPPARPGGPEQPAAGLRRGSR